MLQVKNIYKKHGNHSVLENISFEITENGVYGLLGRNGVGKSTMMNIITGYIGADDGDVIVDGKSILEEPDEVKTCFGYLPEIPPLYMDMTPTEYLYYAAKLKRIPKKDIPAEVSKAIAAVGLEQYKDRLIRNLSKGYKQRTGIAQAALGTPKVIILDEPMVGLDPVQIIDIRRYIQDLGKHSVVLVSSHILSEVKTLCKEILVLADKKTIARNTPEGFEKESAAASGMEIAALGSPEAVRGILDSLDLKELQMLQSEEESVVKAYVCGKEPENLGQMLFTAFSEKGIPLIEMSRRKATLEDIFLSLVASGTIEAED